MIDNEEFIRIEGAKGKTLIVYADLNRLEQHMKELSLADTGVIEELCNAARFFTRYEMPIDKPIELMGSLEMLKMLKMMRMMRAMRKYGKISMQDFATRFSDSFLREAFPFIFENLPDFPMALVLMNLADLHKCNAGWPIGGSLEFTRAIEQRYFDLGGNVRYKSRVAKILFDDDRAMGVRLEDGTEHSADIIISAADGRTTIFDMLEGKYLNDEIRRYYDEWPIYQSSIQISLGVARDFSSEPHAIIFPFDKPINVGNEIRSRAHLRHYCYDSTMAPSGKSVVTVSFLGVNHEYWKKLYKDRQHYKAEKQSLADAMIDKTLFSLSNEKKLP